MILIASDLHLTATPRKSSIDVAAFLRAVEAEVACQPAKLVLLGDIFEFLKSELWLQKNLRPWHQQNNEIIEAALEILEGIHDHNRAFFDSLNSLCDSGKLSLIYTPGNHDGLLAHDWCGPVRKRLREMLCLGSEGEGPFASMFAGFQTYGLYAEHGHSFDTSNKRPTANSRFVPGDLVVIDLLTRLPVEVRLRLHPGEAETLSAALEMLDELDNVLPQDTEGMLGWLEWVRGRLEPEKAARFEEVVLDALRTCITDAAEVARAHGAVGTVNINLLRAADSLGVGTLTIAKRAVSALPASDQLGMLEQRVRQIADGQPGQDQQLFIYASGHTHEAKHHPIPIGLGRSVVHLNSGTWRRVQGLKVGEDGSASFTTFQEESLLRVHARQGAKPPRYELRRVTRGT